ncbi:NADH dehydrogenase [ubiquinone] 1 alpha subcomplex assembly factor 3 isoform X1 [Triticum aestivum]|uniref:NADH dehydrogenase [ubiquinone] 1 alpha subcomplex assembly factor 3 isoform X1 n=1 Tax=Triticum aestivum TaxID=4565 RepID=UPI001D0259BA|nr:NADH dehydrogenase [ubiquinone] 1 alpha subcomplex assembly factor 3-like isoform X1 [Triticum aestivum]
MAAARGQKALATLVRSLRSDSISNSNAPRLRHLPSLRRTFSLYDQINLIDNVPEDQLRFQTYDDTGFKINNVKYEGSLLIVENKILTWTPKTFADITAESLSIFKIVHPIPEILILGCGKYVQPVSPELRKFIRSTGMKLEAIDSVTHSPPPFVWQRNAASTYNILNEEGRAVAAAVLPFGVDS